MSKRQKIDVIITIIVWTLSVAWLVYEAAIDYRIAFEALIGLVGGIVTLYDFWTQSGTSKSDREQAQNLVIDPRKRQQLIDRIRRLYIEGVLYRNLHHQVSIDLGLASAPNAVDTHTPWAHELLTSEGHEQLPPSTHIVDVFDRYSGQILVLGAPGSGKTTTLLTLTEVLLDRSEEDKALPIPVIFNLASWAKKREPLDKWMASELNNIYSVGRFFGQALIEQGQILPLLDGLDEVAKDARSTCIDAINMYRQSRGAELALSCRTFEYVELIENDHKVKLNAAVLLQRLAKTQIEKYLRDAGPELAELRQAMDRDATLYELAEIPLMLSIMVIAYRGLSPEQISGFDSVDQRRRHIFDTYINRVLQRRTKAAQQPISDLQARHYLSTIATWMHKNDFSIFMIEIIQPSLLSRNSLKIYRWLITAIVGSVFGLPFGLILGSTGQWIGAVVGGLIGKAFASVGMGMTIGWNLGLILSVISGLLVGVLYGRTVAKSDVTIATTSLKWSWSSFWKNLVSRPTLLRSLVGGILGFIIISISTVTMPEFESRIDVGIFLGLISGTALMFLGLFLAGIPSALMHGFGDNNITFSDKPNSGIRSSTRYGIVVALTVGLTTGLVVEVLGILLWGPLFGFLTTSIGDPKSGFLVGASLGSSLGLIFGGLLGLFSGLEYGLAASIRHLVLRYLLWRSGKLPWNLARFLDYADERILIQRIGGVYQFIHITLRDYFAELEDEPETAAE